MIEVNFEQQALTMKVVNENSQPFILNIKKLHEKIEPEKSRDKKKENIKIPFVNNLKRFMIYETILYHSINISISYNMNQS